MKRKIAAIFLALSVVVCALFALTACGGKVGVEENRLIITVQNAGEGEKLSAYMDKLEGEGKFTYGIENGMVVSINGKKNALNSYWMLYTDDGENANNSWGTIEVEGKVYASATLGATELPVKNGCTYIWEYQTF